MRNENMTVIQIADHSEIAELLTVLLAITAFDTPTRPLLDVRVGIDPQDDGLKFSINGMTWSPPIVGIISRDA